VAQGVAIMKITKQQLRRLIREEYRRILNENDTSASVGDWDPIRIEIPALAVFATEQNFDGEKAWFSDVEAGSVSEILVADKPTIEDYSYEEDEWQKALDTWEKVHNHLSGWDIDEKEELANNIEEAKVEAEDQGYTS
jgi:hypothetical protein